MFSVVTIFGCVFVFYLSWQIVGGTSCHERPGIYPGSLTGSSWRHQLWIYWGNFQQFFYLKHFPLSFVFLLMNIDRHWWSSLILNILHQNIIACLLFYSGNLFFHINFEQTIILKSFFEKRFMTKFLVINWFFYR